MSLQELLGSAEAAGRIGVPETTFRYWRMVGQGPPGKRIGKSWVYCQQDVDEWIRRRDHKGTNGQSAPSGPA